MVIPCKGATETLDSTEERKMWTQDLSQDLLSFRSLNQESVDALQTARTSSLVDGRLAHIVLSDDKDSIMSHSTSLFGTLKWCVTFFFFLPHSKKKNPPQLPVFVLPKNTLNL